MFSMIGKKGGKTVGIGRGGKNLIKKRKKVSIGGYMGKFQKKVSIDKYKEKGGEKIYKKILKIDPGKP